MFITRVRASAADDRSPWGDFWFQPVGARSAAGARVSPASAMQLSAVFSCVRVLSESFAVLPFRLYRPRKDGRGRQAVTDHWIVRLMNRPNPQQTRYEWREMVQGHLALRGNAFNEIFEGPDGSIAALVPLHPDRISRETTASGWRWVYKDASGQTRYLRSDEVWHLKTLSDDGDMGMSPIAVQREVIGGGLAAQEYGNRFWQNDAKPTGGWVEYPGKIADKATRQTLKESISDAISGVNRHKMMVLDQGMKYHEVGASNKDAQFLESRKYTRTEIASIFRVPPHMIGDLERATFSNIEQQSIDFWQGTMLPWTVRWEAAIEWLIGDDSLQVDFDFRHLLRGDAVSRSAYLHAGVLDGWLTRNEARSIEGYDPIDGLDEPLVPINEREASDDPDDAAAGQQPQQQQAPKQPAKKDGEGDDAEARLQAIVQASAQRLARRAAGALKREPAAQIFDAGFAELMAEALAVSPDSATTWCVRLHAAAEQGAPESQLAAMLVACANEKDPQ